MERSCTTCVYDPMNPTRLMAARRPAAAPSELECAPSRLHDGRRQPALALGVEPEEGGRDADDERGGVPGVAARPAVEQDLPALVRQPGAAGVVVDQQGPHPV